MLSVMYQYFGACAAGLEKVRKIKESLCYVSENANTELLSGGAKEQTYKLADDMEVTLKDERFQVPEALFNPSLIGSKLIKKYSVAL
jgi:actin beta/gamma 1